MARGYEDFGKAYRASTSSCFAGRLGRYMQLNDEEAGLIARMESGERQSARGETLVSARAPVDELFVLKEGWAIAATQAGGDQRQTLRIYLPGEVIGLPGLGIARVPHEVRMLTDGKVCPFPKSQMSKIYDRAPRLAALFTAITSMDQVSLMDRLAVMGAGDARQRMAHFMLDIHERLLFTNPDLGRRFRLPLRQLDIAEVLGLTKVYVNRLLKAFTQEGLIEIERPYIRILQPHQMRDMCNFENRYMDFDSSWFPAGRVHS